MSTKFNADFNNYVANHESIQHTIADNSYREDFLNRILRNIMQSNVNINEETVIDLVLKPELNNNKEFYNLEKTPQNIIELIRKIVNSINFHKLAKIQTRNIDLRYSKINTILNLLKRKIIQEFTQENIDSLQFIILRDKFGFDQSQLQDIMNRKNITGGRRNRTGRVRRGRRRRSGRRRSGRRRSGRRR
jgi:hypothetical protein